MEIKKKIMLTLMLALVTVTVIGQKKECGDTQSKQETEVFLYSPDEKQGFHVAAPLADGSISDLGVLFSSDYSRWGSEKRMYSPFVCRLDGGGYVAVFQVNDYAPCFAVTRSVDLITWRPQDYPRMSVSGCLAPVVRSEGNNRYTVIFKTKDGVFRKTSTDADFRHFSADVSATADEYSAANTPRDSVSVGGKLFSGYKQLLPARLMERLKTHFSTIAADAGRNAETLENDEQLKTLLGGKAVVATLTIDGKRQKDISDKLIGVFFEDISHAADGGLYAELVQNRDFEYSSRDRKGWTSTTSWRTSSGILNIKTDNPINKNNPHYAVLTSDTLFNTGWDGITVKKGAKYDFSFFANNLSGKSKTIIIAIRADGRVIASSTIKTTGTSGTWKKYETVLTATADADKAELVLIPQKPFEVALDMISLFPQDTYNGRKNGLRKDLAQTIADLHPKFIRFPGGCMSHGDGIDNIYHWWHSVGPLEERRPDNNIWRYHQTRGLGFYEYFQFCEDICAEPLPVLAAGVPCQNSGPDVDGYGGQQGGISMDSMQAYVQEICDLIEWANGDPATNKWAKMRADAGHPAPFNLKYIGIGNEDLISTAFEERCLMICKAIKERYPDITVCGTVGPFHAPSSDYIEGWEFARANKDVIDMVDEHYYESVGWFLNNQHYYDNYDRTAPKVYLGEYAARMGKRYLDCALAEAIHLCNIERNADVVAMTSYAPLLSKNGHSNWSPDMIYFDNKSIQRTPNYETQRLFSTYSGNRYVTSTLQIDSIAGHRVAASVVRDTKTGQAFLKVVNVLPVELNLDVTANNLPIANIVRYEGFSGKPGQQKVSVERGTSAK
ncbi:MAG: alpha-L-arabinofuranosidase C-terminal domain-containing protein, partial [Prevotella sp.]